MDTTKHFHLRAVAVAIGAAALIVSLTGCEKISSEQAEPKVSAPISVEDAGYDSFHTKVPGVDYIVTCFEDGIGKSSTLSCFKGSQDIPKDKIDSLEDLGYELSFVKSEGVTVACLEDGFGKSSVLSCFPAKD